MKTFLVTGGAGFIGCNFIHRINGDRDIRIVNLDKLTYAGHLASLEKVKNNPNYLFVRGSIEDRTLISQLLKTHQPDAILNFAAESHVDRSILGPENFIQTNVVGTFHLLDETKQYWNGLQKQKKDAFRFLHVSTDEVYGSLDLNESSFNESTPYAPNSPYAASKAASDHLVRAYHHTFGVPTLVTHCSNNYGPFQFPEKLIPVCILNALEGKPIPVYGDGLNVRDWLFVEDHCLAIQEVLQKGRIGQNYNIGGKSEMSNIDLVKTICNHLDKMLPSSPYIPHFALVKFVKDRPGHDRRYAIDISKIQREIGWSPRVGLDEGIRLTVQWYLNHPEWIQTVKTKKLEEWVDKNYAQR